jgi:Zn-dependent protease with chaperone function
MVRPRQSEDSRATRSSVRSGSTLQRSRRAHSSTLSKEMTTPVPPAWSATRRARAVIKPSAATALLEPQQPAAVATGRVFGASVLLGLLGLASAVFVITRLFESWQVSSEPASHVVSIFGARLAYPAANAGAIVVTVLAGLGLLMAGAAAWRLVRELLADRSFRRALASSPPVPLDGAWVITDEHPQAFCAGLLRPRVYFSTGALELLDPSALAAVLAHERHHAIRHDPLRLACGRVLAAGLFFIPGMRRLVQRQDTLAEISADEAAVLTAGVERSGLASAMLSFSQASSADALGIDPERVDYLLGERTQWRFPVALCLGIVAALSLLVAVAVLAAHTAAGSATLAPPFLSSQPCVAVLAMIPAAAGLAGLAYARTRPTPQPVAPAQQ